MPSRLERLLVIIGPGILVAATGVGAGDLATGAISGSKLGTTVLWAVLLGAMMKFVLNEGLARWQLATGETLLEGCVSRFGLIASLVFLPYLLLWSFQVGSALISACGVTMHALLVPLGSQTSDVPFWGLFQSLIALWLVELGGYRLFEKVMSVCIAVMFVVVIYTAIAVGPSWSELVHGLFVPTIRFDHQEGIQWTVALLGGVGGTLTILCYGYWIREEGRSGGQHLGICRLDLATGYVMTALFGIAMVVIGSRIHVTGKGAGLMVDLARQLDLSVGPTAKWAFLIGAWGAVFSSLLGVWQSVPYLFADLWSMTWNRHRRTEGQKVDTQSKPYLLYLYLLALVPLVGVGRSFERTQKTYAIVGALFIPMLAVVLLVLNGRRQWVGDQFRNRWPTVTVLVVTLILFAYFGWSEINR